MNRQLVPSIVLSVLIVCFFAVAFFERDPPRRVADGPSMAGRDTSGRSVQAAKPAPPRTRLPEGRDGVAARAVLDPAVDRSREQEPRAVSAAVSSAPVRRASARSNGATDPVPVAAPDRANDASALARRTPRSVVTVVREDETIDDVALRVYGTSTQADALWRANRDALPHKDTPLSAGMLLRTPTLR